MNNQTLMYQSPKSQYASFSIDDVMKQVQNLMQTVYQDQDKLIEGKNICIDAIKYHFESPGQNFRAKSCINACMKLGINYDDMLILAASSELLHNASLIHDDIQDEDQTRRGQPSLWSKYGSSIAICAGDLLISAAYGVLTRYSKSSHLPNLINAINHHTATAIKGQSSDILFKQEKQISLDEYVSTAKQKSGALICLPIELALISAERMDDINLAKMACYNFSVGYQIADDLEDIIKDTKHSQAGQSLNITTVLKESGAVDIHQKATMMCNKYLDDAMTYANQLPNQSGSFLVSLATKLKRKISHNLI